MNPEDDERRLLIVEDDVRLRKSLAAHLERQNARVVEATRLSEAKRLLEQTRFDFAVLDLHLPDGDSLELLRAGVFSENTGIVVMTAFGGVKQAVEAIRLGASDYLSKPFEPEELTLALLRSQFDLWADSNPQNGGIDLRSWIKRSGRDTGNDLGLSIKLHTHTKQAQIARGCHDSFSYLVLYHHDQQFRGMFVL